MGRIKRVVRWIGRVITAIGQWIERAAREPVQQGEGEGSEETVTQREFGVEPYTPAEDELGREKFTRHIAKYIKNWDDDESLVLAIYGGWGEGKTFLKDRVLEEIYGKEKLKDPSEAIPVVQYNPWRWSGQDELYEGFFQKLEERFRDLGAKKGRSSTEWKSLADDANAVAASRGVAFSATQDLGAILGVFLTIVAFLGIPQLPDTFSGLPFLLPRGWLSDETLRFLVMDTPLNLIAVKWWLGIISLISFVVWIWGFGKYKYFLAKASQAQRSLGEVRHSIEKTLKDLYDKEESILIVIDDIDRLTADQIRMMMQLVKANANFVGIKYLLLFERQVVEKSLDDLENGIKGRDFLQKIVRRGFDLPAMPTSKLLDHFNERLRESLEEQLATRVQGCLTGTVFRRLLSNHFLHYLKTLRDVDRLLGTLPLHLKLYDSGGNRLDIHIPDLFCVEVFRVFEPGLFREIQKFRDELTVTVSHFQDDSGHNKNCLKEVQKALLKKVDSQDIPTAKNLLHELFPLLEWAEQAPKDGGWSQPVQEWFAQNRVAHRSNFNRYFERALSEGDVSQGLVDDLLYPGADSNKALAETWHKLTKRREGKGVEDALHKLKDRTNEISDPERFLIALFNSADDFPSKSQNSLVASPRMFAVDFVRRVLEHKIDDSKTREELLKNVLDATSSPLFSCQVVEEITNAEKERRDDSNEAVTYSDDAIEKGKARCVSKIKEAGENGLIENDNLMYLLVRWYRWGDEQAPKVWLKRVLSQDNENVFLVLKGFRRSATPGERSSVQKKHGFPSSHAVHVKWLDKFSALGTVQEIVNSLREDDLKDEKEKLIHIFDIASANYQNSQNGGEEGQNEKDAAQEWGDDTT